MSSRLARVFLIASACWLPGRIGEAAHVAAKSVDPLSVPPGATATFRLLVDNVTAGALLGCQIQDGVPGCVTLVPGSCAASPPLSVNCGVAPPNVVSTTAPFDVPAGGQQEITFQVTAGNQPGGCTNTFELVCSNFDEIARVTLTITGGPGAAFAKSVAPATVAPGGRATFTLVLDNATGTSDLQGCVLTDPIAGACMTLDRASCTSAPPLALDCGLIVPDWVNTVTAPFTVPAGIVQRVSFAVTAGGAASCLNTADVECNGGTYRATAQATLSIGTSPGCTLYGADVTVEPVTPPRTGGWVYTTACPPAANRLATALPVLSLTPPALLDTPDPFAGPGGTLRLYQIECGCSAAIRLAKNLATGHVRIGL